MHARTHARMHARMRIKGLKMRLIPARSRDDPLRWCLA